MRVLKEGCKEDGAVLVANLNLVDLAGSENVRVVVVVVVL